MLERASGQFIVDGQVEDILGGISGAARIARISQSCRFTGQFEGESMAEFTAVLPHEGDGSFHGFQRIAGTLGEREGTFVVSVTGAYAKGYPRGEWVIVPKSGSGDFTHIRGRGTFSLPDGKPGFYRFEFDLRKPRAAKQPVESEIEAMKPADEPVAPPAVPAKPTRKPRTTKTEPLVEASVETPGDVPTPRKPSRKTASEPVLVATAASSKPKRMRTAGAQPEPEPVASASRDPQLATPRPSRRKTTVSPEPAVLPIDQQTPVRKRRTKAA